MKLPFDTHIFPTIKGVYVVGGSVRDLLSGRTPADYDLAVEDDPEIFARRLASRLSTHVVKLGKPGQTVQRVITKNYFFDILPVAGSGIQDDLGRRDFTVNAMALELSSQNLIDPLEGQRDLAAGKIRMVSRNAFLSDPLRLIRAFRLAAAFDWAIEAETTAAIVEDAHLIQRSAAERIRDEFVKILQQQRSWDCLGRMAETGLLFVVFPELQALKKCRASSTGSADRFARSLGAYRYLEKLLNPQHPANVRQIYPDKGAENSALLKMAVLFHDIAHPCGQNRASLSRLAVQSAAQAGAICRRLRFSRHQCDIVALLIRNHTRPFYMFRARQNKTAAQKALINIFLKCDHTTDDVLVTAMAVFSSQRKLADFCRGLLQHYYDVLRPRAARPPVLTGKDLISEFELKPSRLFARLLRRVKQECLLRKSLSRQQAVKLVGDLLKRQRKNRA